MAAITQLAILFCGQGMSTLIEYYAGGDITAAPDNLVLVDFGGNQKYSEGAAAYVVGKLEKQANPKFDLVIISHQDGDHLSLLGALKTAIEEAGLEVSCDDVYAGGLVWSAANKKRVSDFVEAMDMEDDDIAFNCPRESNYDEATERSELGSICDFGNTSVRVLVSGVKLSKAPQDITRNASSAFIIVENESHAIALPGDSTYHTMKVVNEFYEAWDDDPLIPPVFTLEVPHHGALRTAVENYSAKTPLADLNFDIIEEFAGYMNPDFVVASAGPYNTHCHPVKEVMDVFDAGLVDYDDHTYVAYVFDRKKSKKHEGWDQFDSEKGVLTTVMQIDGGTRWGDQIFEMHDATADSPAKVVRRFEPRGLMSDLMADHLAARASGQTKPGPTPASGAGDVIFRAPPPDAPKAGSDR